MKKLIALTAVGALGLGAWFLVLVDPPFSREQEQPPGVELMAMPTKVLRRCRALRYVAAVCPLRAPLITSKQGRPRVVTIPVRKYRHDIISIEWSGPYPKLTPKNSPPRFAHVVAVGGELEFAFQFEWPMNQRPREEPIMDKRVTPVILGRPSWRGEDGILILAPSFPWGGLHGDHLVYRWSEGTEDYALSLHAWQPLEKAIATLRALVLSA
ncbi:MAG: hypothetical protein ACRDJJ_05970 [Actinomycetota bacterium]